VEPQLSAAGVGAEKVQAAERVTVPLTEPLRIPRRLRPSVDRL